MAFADWKKTSKVFCMFRDRANNYGIGLEEACQAAYKAGERQGHKDAGAPSALNVRLGELPDTEEQMRAERERCANLCESMGAMDALEGEDLGSAAMVRVADRMADLCAAAIRAA